jgi:hypothetical protein
VIYANDLLAKQSIQYESDVLNYLQNNYTSKQLSNIKTIQFNNESKHVFGDEANEIDDSANIASVTNVMENFPKFANVKFMFNSAGFFDIEGLETLFGKLKDKYPQIKLVMGIDYYPIDVGSVDLPLVGKANPENVAIFGRIDPLVYDNLLGNEFQKAKDNAFKLNYKILISELQVEPWDGNAKLPGNIVQDFNYATERGIEILPSKEQAKAQDNVEEDVWGLEYLEKNKNDHDCKQILQEIKETNSK